MEKRKSPPEEPVKPPEPVKDDSSEQMVTALQEASHTSALAISIVSKLEQKIEAAAKTSEQAIGAIADAVKPRNKIIDVAVTKRDLKGHPSHYRITVKQE